MNPSMEASSRLVARTRSAKVEALEIDSWRLSLPAGDAKAYRLAQLDDTNGLARRRFPWRPPCSLELEARISSANLPGTWGFGFWNVPLNFGGILTSGGISLPALPQCAWFFSAGTPNHLSFYDNVPGSGFFAGLIRSRRIPLVFLAPGVLAAPFLLWRPTASLIRRMCRLFLAQHGETVDVDPTTWHLYSIELKEDQVTCSVDGQVILSAQLAPAPPLSLVIWIDNQYAAFTPQGRVGWGVSANPECWLEVRIKSPLFDVNR